MKLKIKEKTALLDQMMFGNVQIVGFDDLKKLEKSGVVEQTTAKVKYITATGQEFTRLLIERDGVINRMIAGSKLIKGKRIDYCNLSVSVGNKETGNLMCLTRDEYMGKLQKIEEHLKNQYGIHVDLSDITMKEIEINRTFKLNEDFEKYHRVINLMMCNLPKNLKQQSEYKKVNDGIATHESYYASSKTGKAKNKVTRYLELKIYDKTKAVEKIILLTDSFMRVEFRLVGAEKIKRSLKVSKFVDLTDAIINDYFAKQTENIIVQPFEKWKIQRDKEVVELMKEWRSKDMNHWQTSVLRSLMNREITEKKAVLLDIKELLPLVNRVITKANRRYDVKHNFVKQAEKIETVFCNDDHLKMEEIIEKLTATDTDSSGISTDSGPDYTGITSGVYGIGKIA